MVETRGGDENLTTNTDQQIQEIRARLEPIGQEIARAEQMAQFEVQMTPSPYWSSQSQPFAQEVLATARDIQFKVESLTRHAYEQQHQSQQQPSYGGGGSSTATQAVQRLANAQREQLRVVEQLLETVKETSKQTSGSRS
jgi:hypothetical protein